jgi:hypothetical protein
MKEHTLRLSTVLSYELDAVAVFITKICSLGTHLTEFWMDLQVVINMMMKRTICIAGMKIKPFRLPQLSGLITSFPYM